MRRFYITECSHSTFVFIILMTATALHTSFQFVARGEKRNKVFAISGVICTIVMLALAFVANIIAYFLFGTILAFAVATLVVMVLWLLICEIDDKEWHYSWQAYVSLAIVLSTYLVTGNMSNTYIGCAIYVVVGITTALVFMRPTVKYLLGSLIQRKRQKSATASEDAMLDDTICQNGQTDMTAVTPGETVSTGEVSNRAHSDDGQSLQR